VLVNDFSDTHILEKLHRYEVHIERGFYRALKELRTAKSEIVERNEPNSAPRHAHVPQQTPVAPRNKVAESPLPRESSIPPKRDSNSNLQSTIDNTQSFAPTVLKSIVRNEPNLARRA
jgi:hypothetical protein